MTDQFQSREDLGSINRLERLNYVLGQVLGVQEFRQEQAYFLNKAQVHNRALHGYGIVEGLAVTCSQLNQASDLGNAGDYVVEVSPGLAIDQQGREIWVTKPQCANLSTWLASQDFQSFEEINEFKLVYIGLNHVDSFTREQLILDDPHRTDRDNLKPTRIHDSFRINFLAENPTSSELENIHKIISLLDKIKVVPNLDKPRIDHQVYEKETCQEELCKLIKAQNEESLQRFLIPKEMINEILHSLLHCWVTQIRPSFGDSAKGDSDLLISESLVLLACLQVKADVETLSNNQESFKTIIRVKVDTRQCPYVLSGQLIQTLAQRYEVSLSNALENRINNLEHLFPPSFRFESGYNFLPNHGPKGTLVTLYGKSLHVGEVTVKFGEFNARIERITHDEIDVRVPETVEAGPTKITVQTNGGLATSSHDFRVILAPLFTETGSQFSPQAGPPGTQVTLRGQHFGWTAGMTTVFFSEVRARITNIGPTEIRVIVPEMETNSVNIKVETSAGSIISDDRFNVQGISAPSFATLGSQFSPQSAPSGSLITLHGQRLDLGEVSVFFGSAKAEIVNMTSTSIQVKVPQISPGTLKIKIETGGGSVISDDSFSVQAAPAPLFADSGNQFAPQEGARDAVVTLYGQHFNVGEIQVLFNTTIATVLHTSSNEIKVRVPQMSTGSVKIKVITSGGSVTSDDSFDVQEVTIPTPVFAESGNQFSPKEGFMGTIATLTLNGENFDSVEVTQVFLGSTNVRLLGQTSNQIRFRVPLLSPQSIDHNLKIGLVTVAGNVVSDDTFRVRTRHPLFAEPGSQFSPREGAPNTVVTINGQNLTSLVEILFGTQKAQIIPPVLPQLRVRVPNMSAGPVKITVTSTYGSVTSDDTFEVLSNSNP